MNEEARWCVCLLALIRAPIAVCGRVCLCDRVCVCVLSEVLSQDDVHSPACCTAAAASLIIAEEHGHSIRQRVWYNPSMSSALGLWWWLRDAAPVSVIGIESTTRGQL